MAKTNGKGIKELIENSPNPAQTLANYSSGYVLGHILGTLQKEVKQTRVILQGLEKRKKR